MSVAVTRETSPEYRNPESVIVDVSCSSSSSGREIKVLATSESELLQIISSIFQQNVHSIDFTDIVFGESFQLLIDGVKESNSIKTVTLTKSKLTTDQISKLNMLASQIRGLRLVDSEGGFVGGPHTNWRLYYQTLYQKEAELEATQPRRTPDAGIKIYRARYKRLPAKTMDIGAADGSNTIPLMLMGCKNIDALDIDQGQGELFAQKLAQLSVTKLAVENNIKYHLCEFMNFPLDEKQRYEFLISNYVWSYRSPENFTACFERSVESVAEDGFLCGEFFGKPKNAPRQGLTFHTLEEAISLLQFWNLEILYFEVEPHQVSLDTRKDAETIPWGDLYRVAVRKTRTSEAVQPSDYTKIKDYLSQPGSPTERRIFNVLEYETFA